MSSQSYPAHEGLQTVDPASSNGIEALINDGPEAAHSQEKEVSRRDDAEKEAVVGEQTEKNICGLRRRTFWVVLSVICVLVVAAAVGGGIGGAVSRKSSSSGNRYLIHPNFLQLQSKQLTRRRPMQIAHHQSFHRTLRIQLPTLLSLRFLQQLLY
jgi:hypothetical protein